MNLSPQERLILSNQYRILALLDKRNAESYAESAAIVENGYELAYDWLAPSIDAPVSAKVCQEVIDILNLFRYFAQAADREGATLPQRMRFVGFDGNNEGEHYSFASFLVRRQGKWPDLFLGKPTEDINSHRHVLEGYLNMLRRWRELGGPTQLTMSQATEIAGP